MKTNLTRLLSVFVLASAPLAGTATLFANIYADTYSCRPVNAHTTLQGSVRLITSPSYSLPFARSLSAALSWGRSRSARVQLESRL